MHASDSSLLTAQSEKKSYVDDGDSDEDDVPLSRSVKKSKKDSSKSKKVK